jgi:hypothetical protein
LSPQQATIPPVATTHVCNHPAASVARPACAASAHTPGTAVRVAVLLALSVGEAVGEGVVEGV